MQTSRLSSLSAGLVSVRIMRCDIAYDSNLIYVTEAPSPLCGRRLAAAPSKISTLNQEVVMVRNELLLLSIQAVAAAFKLGALVLAVAWAARVACPPTMPLDRRSLSRRG